MSARVLIVRQDNIGDVLLAGPAVRAVAAAGASVTLLCGPRGRAAAELLPGAADVLVWRADWIDPEPKRIEPAHVEQLVDSVAARDFTEALVLTSFHQSPLPIALLLRMAGVPRIAAISEDYPGSLLDLRHRVDDGLHEVERGLSLAHARGYGLPPDDDGRLRIRRTAGLDGRAAALAPYVVVHPGASAPARAWSPERHAELVRTLTGEGRNVVVTGGAQERGLTAAVCRGAAPERVADLGGETDIAALGEVLAAAEAVVVANTGPAHLAAAVGTPVVSIYAPTVPAPRWRPWGVPFVLLHQDVPCAGCHARECPVRGHPCVESVTAKIAGEALAGLIDRRPVLRLVPGPCDEPSECENAVPAEVLSGTASALPVGERLR
jgi:ADP-heptose:LPS heptosyltransferase